MIERWFPCSEVSEASGSGWGSGKSEKALFTWFAARPLAQAKAAVLTSLLPWPDDVHERRRLQDLVREAMTGRDAAHADLLQELAKAHPDGASILDPFSGRAMIPLEAARLGVTAHGIDYSPVATLAGQLLADYPLRDWTAEPHLPFGQRGTLDTVSIRLLDDVHLVLDEIGRRYAEQMAAVYPLVEGRQPWGYLWAVTLPCQECGRRFPLIGSLTLRHPVTGDPGQGIRIDADRANGGFRAVIHDGMPVGSPTLVARTRDGKAVKGKSAVCPFCDHVHSKPTHQRLAQEGLGVDFLLAVADLDGRVGKIFREPTTAEHTAAELIAPALLAEEAPFGHLPAVPSEEIPPGNSDTIRASVYGATNYGELCNPRQTLGFVRLARVISDLGTELTAKHGLSDIYAAALTGYASSVLVRKLKYGTRGATLLARKEARANRLNTNPVYINHIFTNEASLGFSYDYFETGLGDGPGTWPSLADDTLTVLRNQASRAKGCPADIQRGSALSLPFRKASVSAVITDPPYDNMIDYSDASDLFYVWLKRALYSTSPWFAFTAHDMGVQEKTEEIIVKRFRAWKTATDHRTKEHYDRSIARAFAEARRVVRSDGVVTIVFGHGDPEVWHRLLQAITRAELVLTGSWPAKTEAGGSAGSANIVTTLTMSCRPAPPKRDVGRANLVEAEVRQEVKARIPMWDAAGLAPTDQLMASAGPAMEAVGRYEQVLNHLGDPVDPAHYLVVARRAVEDAAAVVIDHLPLETFDLRTRFALSWARLYRRSVAPKSEARWQALAGDLSADQLKGILHEADKGVRLGYASDWKGTLNETAATIDVAMAMAKAWPDGLDAVAEVLVAAGRDTADSYLWAAIGYLSSLLPEADPDAMAWTSLVRGRRAIGAVTRGVVSARRAATDLRDARDRQGSLFDVGWNDNDETPGEPHEDEVAPVIAEEAQ
jgi:putative DNA methylase